jgi:septum formation protein
VLGNEILGKPGDVAQAQNMLRQLRGQTHSVYTGICVRHGQKSVVSHVVTRVTFGDFSDEFITRYVATGEPMDKAGAYAAQGKGTLLIAKIEGDYFNVVGLPLFETARVLREFGVAVEEFWS